MGNTIRKHRKALDLTQEELAERCGLHPNYIGLVERGERNLPVLSLLVLAEGLRVRPEELLVGVAGIDMRTSEMETSRLRRRR